ncbi:hypothetical protein [Microbispora sp. H11081]|uniref:hypothetical protein n=1 Tax=Microbispora sp. H11081 TaxID=2729107 RepID=UPI0014748458|nr:hypothetical protein [Microbispora sp. H11081]
MGDSRAGTSRAVASARGLAVAAILLAVSGVATAPAPALGRGPYVQSSLAGQSSQSSLVGQGSLGKNGETSKKDKKDKKAKSSKKDKNGKKGKKGKNGKGGKGAKGKGNGAHLGARLAGFGPGGVGGGLGGGGFGGGFGDDGGGGIQRTTGLNTANAPTISSPPYQSSMGTRNVNAPAGNSAVDFAGVQQVSSVSVFTNSLSGNCRNGIRECPINQSLRSVESRGDIGH